VTATRRIPLRIVAAQLAATALLPRLALRSISTHRTARLTHGLPPIARAMRTRTASVSRATLLSTTLTRRTAEHPRSALRLKLCTTTTSFPRSPTPTTSLPDTSRLGMAMAGTATCSIAQTAPAPLALTSNTTALTLWRPTTRPKRLWVRLPVLSIFSTGHLQHLDPVATFRSWGLSFHLWHLFLQRSCLSINAPKFSGPPAAHSTKKLDFSSTAHIAIITGVLYAF
jgi:hypothetical protein